MGDSICDLVRDRLIVNRAVNTVLVTQLTR